MTVLMKDATDMLQSGARDAINKGDLFEVLYADDTLLIGKEPKHVEEFARAVEAAGAEYGMSLHWGKVQAMPVCSTRKLKQENGEPMKQCDAILYLGGLISNYGQAESELSRRIGTAHGEFRKLRQVWNHANLTASQPLG